MAYRAIKEGGRKKESPLRYAGLLTNIIKLGSLGFRGVLPYCVLRIM